MRPSFARPAQRLRFAHVAVAYWLTVFPPALRELHRWRQQATAIPDLALRTHALDALAAKAWNPQGAAAFAVLAPGRHRPAVVRALVTFQVTYDYLDTLSEQPAADPVANARQLHSALPAIFLPERGPPPDYYRYHSHNNDGGYLPTLVGACRAAFLSLPAHAIVAQRLSTHSGRIAEYQALNASPDDIAFARWANAMSPSADGMRWWELAAAAGSSLAIHALIAATSHQGLSPPDADAIEHAYVPWIGALHTLLDSLIDQPQDMRDGLHSFVGHYGTPGHTAVRLGALAERSVVLATDLRGGEQHALILAAMTSYYLSAPEADLPHACEATRSTLSALGIRAQLAMNIFRLRRSIGRRLKAVRTRASP